MRKLLLVLLLLVVAALGCAEKPAEEAAPAPAPEEAVEAVAAEMVDVVAEGSEFDPPVAIEQLPEGVWFCDMGTVHYARPEHGDGKCPLCGMELKENLVAAVEDDHGHSHDEGADHTH